MKTISITLVVACGISFPNWGLNPGPQHWEAGVLGPGPLQLKDLTC